MSDNASSGRTNVRARERESYRERLASRSLLVQTDEEGASEQPNPDVEALQALVDEVDHQGATFQSVAIAAVQILEEALCCEREAAEAALSLGQQEKLGSMVETGQQAAAILRTSLSTKGTNVMHLCPESNAPRKGAKKKNEQKSGQPWWFALADALEVLEEGTGRMSSLTTAQPPGSPARRLSELVTQLLRDHHDALLLEAEEWIS